MKSLCYVVCCSVVVAAVGCGQTNVSPDQTVKNVAQGIVDKKPQVLWEYLPKSYQKDVTDLIHEFAGKMDKELWTKGFTIAQKATRVLQEKKEFILAHPKLANFVVKAFLRRGTVFVERRRD